MIPVGAPDNYTKGDQMRDPLTDDEREQFRSDITKMAHDSIVDFLQSDNRFCDRQGIVPGAFRPSMLDPYVDRFHVFLDEQDYYIIDRDMGTMFFAMELMRSFAKVLVSRSELKQILENGE